MDKKIKLLFPVSGSGRVAMKRMTLFGVEPKWRGERERGKSADEDSDRIGDKEKNGWPWRRHREAEEAQTLPASRREPPILLTSEGTKIK